MRMRLVATLAVLLVRHQNDETAEKVDEINEQLDAVPVNTRIRDEINEQLDAVPVKTRTRDEFNEQLDACQHKNT